MQIPNKTLLPAIIVASLALALSACGGATIGSVPSGSSGSGSGTSPTVSIDRFAVQGTDGVTAVSEPGTTPGTATIDRNQYGGLFSVQWMTSPSSGAAEQINVSLSTAANGTSGGDQLILERNCNTASSTDCSGTGASFQCRFDGADMQVICPASSTSSADIHPVGNYLANNGGLPNSYFLVMQACVTDNGNAICDVRSLAVTLR